MEKRPTKPEYPIGFVFYSIDRVNRDIPFPYIGIVIGFDPSSELPYKVFFSDYESVSNASHETLEHWIKEGNDKNNETI